MHLADGHREESAACLEAVIEACGVWAWQMDAVGDLTFSSDACRSLFGLTAEEMRGRSYFSLLSAEGADNGEERLRAALASGQPISRLLHQVRGGAGQGRPLEMDGMPLRGPDGQLRGYSGLCRTPGADIRMDRRQPEFVQPVQGFHEFESIYDSAPVALCLADRHGRYVQFNREFCRALGISASAIEGRYISDFSLEGAHNFQRDIEVFDRGGNVPDHELNLRGRFYQVQVRPVRDGQGRVVGATVAMTDISVYKRAERVLAAANERLQATAERDFLTGLLNRRQFEEIYRVEVSAARREQAPVSLLIADVDHFKRFNDRYGHPAGDICLRKVAQALANALSRPRDVVCRYGGEEFIAILPNTEPEGALVVAERARQAVWDLDIEHATSKLGRISVSMGGATLMRINPAVDMAHRRRLMVDAADAALYEAKRAGRNRVRAAHMPIDG
ncbi:diguanylate cyclase [Xanthobacter sp. TB0139]|uniref:diguanylate cyclase n=1 Tax=Xanthobacter sp. TB0139 TaxID=3459178 RepID=UPI00403950BB